MMCQWRNRSEEKRAQNIALENLTIHLVSLHPRALITPRSSKKPLHIFTDRVDQLIYLFFLLLLFYFIILFIVTPGQLNKTCCVYITS